MENHAMHTQHGSVMAGQAGRHQMMDGSKWTLMVRIFQTQSVVEVEQLFLITTGRFIAGSCYLFPTASDPQRVELLASMQAGC
jgi:hypothetical protein